MKSDFIALISDFGNYDPFVSLMKGVIYSNNKKVKIIDITHHIPPQDIKTCAFYLMVSMTYMPPKTLFVAVVDPDVGTGRGILYARTENYQFIAPDNGIISWIEEKEKIKEVRFINNSELFLDKISMTFHGRDIMSPAAAKIALGYSEEKIGPIINEYRKFEYPHPNRIGTRVTGEVIAIDRFGNVITNLNMDYVSVNSIFNIGSIVINGIKTNYASVPPNMPLCVIGSYDLLEFSVRNGNFAKTYAVKVGNPVEAIINL